MASIANKNLSLDICDSQGTSLHLPQAIYPKVKNKQRKGTRWSNVCVDLLLICNEPMFFKLKKGLVHCETC